LEFSRVAMDEAHVVPRDHLQGYPMLSEVARSLETAAKAQDVCKAGAAFAEVKKVCAAIQAGLGRPLREVDQS
jgi:hypothetical protein